MKKDIKLFLFLHIFLMLYTTGGIFSKLAAGEAFLSLRFLLFYGAEIALLAFYAIGWQQFVKRMPLSVAYANKAVTVIWGIVWGVLIFQEQLTAGKVIGGLLVLGGVILYGYADGKGQGSGEKDRTADGGVTGNE